MEEQREFDKLTEIMLTLELIEKDIKAIKDYMEAQEYLNSRYFQDKNIKDITSKTYLLVERKNLLH